MPNRKWAGKDFYGTLGVERDASRDDIKRAYRKLARQHHPDVNPGSKAAEDRFKAITEAYDVLVDGQTRKEYDDGRIPPDRGTTTHRDTRSNSRFDDLAAMFRDSRSWAMSHTTSVDPFAQFDPFGRPHGGAARSTTARPGESSSHREQAPKGRSADTARTATTRPNALSRAVGAIADALDSDDVLATLSRSYVESLQSGTWTASGVDGPDFYVEAALGGIEGHHADAVTSAFSRLVGDGPSQAMRVAAARAVMSELYARRLSPNPSKTRSYSRVADADLANLEKEKEIVDARNDARPSADEFTNPESKLRTVVGAGLGESALDKAIKGAATQILLDALGSNEAFWFSQADSLEWHPLGLALDAARRATRSRASQRQSTVDTRTAASALVNNYKHPELQRSLRALMEMVRHDDDGSRLDLVGAALLVAANGAHELGALRHEPGLSASRSPRVLAGNAVRTANLAVNVVHSPEAREPLSSHAR